MFLMIKYFLTLKKNYQLRYIICLIRIDCSNIDILLKFHLLYIMAWTVYSSEGKLIGIY